VKLGCRVTYQSHRCGLASCSSWSTYGKALVDRALELQQYKPKLSVLRTTFVWRLSGALMHPCNRNPPLLSPRPRPSHSPPTTQSAGYFPPNIQLVLTSSLFLHFPPFPSIILVHTSPQIRGLAHPSTYQGFASPTTSAVTFPTFQQAQLSPPASATLTS